MLKKYFRIFRTALPAFLIVFITLSVFASEKHSYLYTQNSPTSTLKLLANLPILLQLEDIQIDTVKKHKSKYQLSILKPNGEQRSSNHSSVPDLGLRPELQPQLSPV